MNEDHSHWIPGSLDQALSAAKNQHPAILGAQAGVHASQAGLAAATSSFGPKLTLSGAICAIDCFGSSAQQGISGSIRLTLSVPIYDGGAGQVRPRQADLVQIKSELEAVLVYDQVREVVIASWSSLKNNTAQIAAAHMVINASQRALEGVVAERSAGREMLIIAKANKTAAIFSLAATTGRLSKI